MKKIKLLDKKIRSTAGKIIIGLVLASLVGGLSAVPASAGDYRRPVSPDRDRLERRDRDRVERRDRDRVERRDRDRVERRNRDRDAYYHRRVYRPYNRTPVYAPPPVFVEPPPPPPGIRIFLPDIIIRIR